MQLASGAASVAAFYRCMQEGPCLLVPRTQLSRSFIASLQLARSAP